MTQTGIEQREKQQSAMGTGHTWTEIRQQPELWPTTAKRVQEGIARLQLQARLKDARVVITGAGTSAYEIGRASCRERV